MKHGYNTAVVSHSGLMSPYTGESVGSMAIIQL